ncbi:MAG: hypothetical protein HC840_04990 [Leptolyngbyaceae cyanobacterium RM2_2_4]|nr:hypothetical protein [Leptolyngbyaceae cyanobacterium RM2_2_4]
MLYKIPRVLVSGDTVSWIDRCAIIPQGRMVFEFFGLEQFQIEGIASNGAFTFTFNQQVKDGKYFWRQKEIDVDRSITVKSGTVIIRPKNLRLDAPQVTAREIADAIKKVILQKVTGGAVEEYRIGDRMLVNYSLEELSKLESIWAARAVREEGTLKENSYIGFGSSNRYGYF